MKKTVYIFIIRFLYQSWSVFPSGPVIFFLYLFFLSFLLSYLLTKLFIYLFIFNLPFSYILSLFSPFFFFFGSFFFSFISYLHYVLPLDATPKHWQTPKSWLTPGKNMIFLIWESIVAHWSIICWRNWRSLVQTLIRTNHLSNKKWCRIFTIQNKHHIFLI